MTRRTGRPARPVDPVDMRKLAIVLLLACGVYQGWPAPPEASEETDRGVEAPPVAAAPPGPLERIGRLVGTEPEPEVAPVPMVHCVLEGEGAYLRRSECLERGGVIDEPAWARSGS